MKLTGRTSQNLSAAFRSHAGKDDCTVGEEAAPLGLHMQPQVAIIMSFVINKCLSIICFSCDQMTLL